MALFGTVRLFAVNSVEPFVQKRLEGFSENNPPTPMYGTAVLVMVAKVGVEVNVESA